MYKHRSHPACFKVWSLSKNKGKTATATAMNKAVAMDEIRIQRLQKTGYHVEQVFLTKVFIKQNRLILAMPSSAAAVTSAATQHQEPGDGGVVWGPANPTTTTTLFFEGKSTSAAAVVDTDLDTFLCISPLTDIAESIACTYIGCLYLVAYFCRQRHQYEQSE
jgi:hypothetical protein